MESPLVPGHMEWSAADMASLQRLSNQAPPDAGNNPARTYPSFPRPSQLDPLAAQLGTMMPAPSTAPLRQSFPLEMPSRNRSASVSRSGDRSSALGMAPSVSRGWHGGAMNTSLLFRPTPSGHPYDVNYSFRSPATPAPSVGYVPVKEESAYILPTRASTYEGSISGGDEHDAVHKAASQSTTGSDGKKRRTRTGCLTCRTRKIKCTEERPGCRRCAIAELECSWPAPTTTGGKRSRKRKQAEASVVGAPDGKRTATAAEPSSTTAKRDLAVAAKAQWLQSFPGLVAGGVLASPSYNEGITMDTLLDPDFIRKISEASTSYSAATTMQLLPPIGTPHTQSTQSMPLPRIDGRHSSNRRSIALQIAHLTRPVEQAQSAMCAGLLDGRDQDGLLSRLVPRQLKMEMLQNPSFLQAYFPSVDEKLVITHYMNETVKNIVALDAKKALPNPWVEHHLPVALCSPRGTSLACDALQLSLLAVGSVHLRYLTRETGPAKTEFAQNVRGRVFAMLRKSIDTSTSDEDTETILAALLSCMIASSLAGDDAWQEVLSLAASLVLDVRRGGVEHFLDRFASRTRQSAARMVLEQLSVREVFGCLSTGCSPLLLASPGPNHWFFKAEKWSDSDDAWESVERQFGISRSTVSLLARVCAVVAKKRSHNYKLAMDSACRPVPSASDASAEPDGLLETQLAANDLLREIDDVQHRGANCGRDHVRVQYGNLAHLHAMTIHLLKHAFDVSSDPRIAGAGRCILELATEMIVAFGRVTWMTWPVLMLGLNLAEPYHRSSVRRLLLDFAPHAFFDNQVAVRLVEEHWALADKGIEKDWFSLTNDLGRGRAPFFD